MNCSQWYGNSDEGVGRTRLDTHLSRQNAAIKRQITTVLLLLVKLRGNHESTLYEKALTLENTRVQRFFQ